MKHVDEECFDETDIRHPPPMELEMRSIRKRSAFRADAVGAVHSDFFSVVKYPCPDSDFFPNVPWSCPAWRSWWRNPAAPWFSAFKPFHICSTVVQKRPCQASSAALQWLRHCSRSLTRLDPVRQQSLRRLQLLVRARN